MDVSVRSIPTDYHRGVAAGYKPALCFRGDKFAHCVIYDELVIHPVKVAIREHDRSPLTQHNGAPYPVAQYLAHMREWVANGKPISRGTLRLLIKGGLPTTGLPSLDDGDDDAAIGGRGRKAPVREGSDVVKRLAAELKMEPRILRKLARRAGLRAPYTDEATLRKAVGSQPVPKKRTVRVDFAPQANAKPTKRRRVKVDFSGS